MIRNIHEFYCRTRRAHSVVASPCHAEDAGRVDDSAEIMTPRPPRPSKAATAESAVIIEHIDAAGGRQCALDARRDGQRRAAAFAEAMALPLEQARR